MSDPTRRAWAAPEVIQTSAMDCGPAALACLLEGFGVPASYARLRDACRTGVDGTSIDDLERVACALGLRAEQVTLPTDHLFEREAHALPAILVVMLPDGLSHFVVVWRRVGRWLQVMDPSSGRRWVRLDQLLAATYVHEMRVPAASWRAYAEGEGFAAVIGARLGRMGVDAGPLLAEARATPGWRGLAALDAALRLTASLVASGALRRGAEAARTVAGLAEGGRDPTRDLSVIPPNYWSAHTMSDTGEITVRGAVLLRVLGRSAPAGERSPGAPPADLPPELEAVRSEPPPRAFRPLLESLRGQESRAAVLSLAVALVAAAVATAAEVVAFRAMVDAYGLLRSPLDRLGAAGAFAALLAALLAVDFATGGAFRRLGRRLELGFRLQLLRKLPLLGDQYFQSRPVSDLAARAHAIPHLGAFPLLAGQLLRVSAELLVTGAAIAWLDPASAPLALAAAAAAVGVPLVAQRRLAAQDLRLRTHAGALGRFYLDALLGVLPVRAHAAERSVRREHEALLVEWARAGRALESTVVAVQAVQGLLGVAVALALVVRFFSRGSGEAAALLLVYWSLALPVLGAQLASVLQQLPAKRNTALRLHEIVAAPAEEVEEGEGEPVARADGAAPARAPIGPALELRDLSVAVSGHLVLRQVSLAVAPGAHVAVLGPSGAGKSTLLGVLLGWHRPSAGEVRIDGRPLHPRQMAALRARTAWVDPTVQIWNRSLMENLRYGAPPSGGLALGELVDAAELRRLLERLPDGMQTRLGEGGGLVSGGEGQRVRFARAAARAGAELVLLDEPFRGLDRPMRRELLRRARRLWSRATLLCVTHDVEQALDFDVVAIVEEGRITALGPPRQLLAQPHSRLAALLDSERTLRAELWGDRCWVRLRMEAGRVDPADPEPAPALRPVAAGREGP